MKMKKLCALLLASAMTLSLAACGSGGDSGKESSEKQESSSQQEESKESEESEESSAAQEGESGGEAASGNEGGLVPMEDADDPITYTFFVRDPGQAPADDNPVLKRITELTGVTLKFEYLVGDLDQKLGTMIAGGDYPDVIFAGDAATKLMDAGAFIPLEDEIPKYPNLNAMYKDVLKYLTQADGHVYNMEIYGTMKNDVTTAAPIFEGSIGFYIQKAVLEEAGYPEIKTLDQYFEVIEAYMEKHPDIDGVKTTGFEILADGWRNWALLNPAQHFLGQGNEGAIFVDRDTLEVSFFQDTDTQHDFLKKENEEYLKGVIEAETLTQSYDDYISKITTGAVLGFFDQNWNFQSANDLLKADGKYERTYVTVPLTNPGVKDRYFDKGSGIPTATNGVGITINCENPERLMRFFDWLCQREVQDYLQWGVEGVDWNYTEDGGKVLTDARRAINYDTARKRDETGHPLWNYCPKWQGVYTSDGMPCGPGESPDEYLASQSDYDKKFLEAYGIKYPAELHSEPEVAPAYSYVWSYNLGDGSPASVASQKITDVTTKYFSRLILAKDDAEFESIWQEYLKEWNAIDLEAYRSVVEQTVHERMEK